MFRSSSWFEWPAKRSRQSKIANSTAIVCLIGIADYLSGWQISWSAVYVYPIAIIAWYVGAPWAYGLSLLSVILYTAGDLATGFAFNTWLVPAWNAVIRLVFYAILIHMLTYIRSLTQGLEVRVLERTAALSREIVERERLEGELLEVGERERRRLSFELHDGLCQHLTGTALAAHVLMEKLTRRGIPEAAEAAKTVDLIEEGISLSRKMAKGLQPVEMHASGLMQALQDFAGATTNQFKISCRFECDAPIFFGSISQADHLYHIAREATTNAIKHGRAHNVVISLEPRDEGAVLTVTDDGFGIPMPLPKKGGMGLTIMAQRAKLIGATFDIRPVPDGGTVATCTVPHPAAGMEINFHSTKQRDPHHV